MRRSPGSGRIGRYSFTPRERPTAVLGRWVHTCHNPLNVLEAIAGVNKILACRAAPIIVLANAKEYFAEMTEAFFGTNDFYPFVRAELQEHDAAMFELLCEVWGVKETRKRKQLDHAN